MRFDDVSTNIVLLVLHGIVIQVMSVLPLTLRDVPVRILTKCLLIALFSLLISLPVLIISHSVVKNHEEDVVLFSWFEALLPLFREIEVMASHDHSILCSNMIANLINVSPTILAVT